MNWTKVALAALLVLGLALTACSDRAENPVSPLAPGLSADKANPQLDPGFFDLWMKNVVAEYESITGWSSTLVSADDFDLRYGHYRVVPERWDEDHYVAIEVTEGNPDLIESVSIGFPEGSDPFFANVMFYKLSVPEGLSVAVFMPEDPTRYGPDVIGDQFTTFDLVGLSGPYGSYSPGPRVTKATNPDPNLAPLFRYRVGAMSGRPDNGGVIVPSGDVPPEDGDD